MLTGTLDPAFMPLPDPAPVRALALRADGTILMSSDTVTLTSLLPDGGADPACFRPDLSGGSVQCRAGLPDGKILMGGLFSKVNGKTREGLARLHADGTLDESFLPPAMFGTVCLAVMPDGRILAGGPHPLSLEGFCMRLLPDGTRENFTATQP